MTRREHLQWAKDRALEYLDKGDLQQAFVSFWSDYHKHEDFRTDAARALIIALGPLALSAVMRSDADALRRWIEGWN